MQKKTLATKIASILLSVAMLVSTTMTALATDGEVSVAAERAEVQTVAETAEDTALEASEEDAATSEEITDGETAAEEEITADEEITKEITSEEAQENVEEAQVLDAEEAQTLDADEMVAVADENDIALAAREGWFDVGGNSNIEFKSYRDNGVNILEFQLVENATSGILPDYTAAADSPWYKKYSTYGTPYFEKVVIGEGITGIGAHNFDNANGNYPYLTTVTLSSTVQKIGKNAFTS